MAMFLFDNPIREENENKEVYFEDKLPLKYKKYSNLTGSIIKLRNILIILTFAEIASSIWGFSYYFIRRVIFT
jgi:hypothetical protein